MGLARGKRVAAADRREAARNPERLQHVTRQEFELVGADGKDPSGGGEAVENGNDAGIEPALHADIGLVMVEEVAMHVVERRRVDFLPLPMQGKFDEVAGAVADAVAGARVGKRPEAIARQDKIERRQEIGGAVDQRAVEVEDEKRRDHPSATNVSAESWQGGLPLVPQFAHAKRWTGMGKAGQESVAEELKRRAAEAALAYVEDGMRLGLGTGSTSNHFIELLGRRVGEGLRVTAVATSERSARLAAQAGIKLTTLDATPELDLDVDGADEIGPGLALTKGGGGSLLREKIVAHASARMIVIADHNKRVAELGAFPLPIEVVEFGLTATALAIERAAIELGLNAALDVRRQGSAPFVTDGGNRILDASFGRIPDPEALAGRLAEIPGIVEHGLFLGFADLALLASPDGVTEIAA